MFLTVVVALLTWVSLYVALISIWPQQKYEWHCRIVTTGHAMLIVALSGWSVFIEGPWPFTEPAGPNTTLQEFACAISFGYFVFDFLWCVYFQTEGPVMLFHHALSMFGDMMVLTRGINGCELMATLLGTELTNPLLQMRWFIRHSSVNIPWYLKEMVDLGFLTLFTFLRIGVGSLFLFYYLSHPLPDVIARGGAVSIYLIGWIFWIALLRYAWRKYILGITHPSRSSLSRHDDKKEYRSSSPSASLMNNQCNFNSKTVDRGDHVMHDQKTQNKVSNLAGFEMDLQFRHRTILTEEFTAQN